MESKPPHTEQPCCEKACPQAVQKGRMPVKALGKAPSVVATTMAPKKKSDNPSKTPHGGMEQVFDEIRSKAENITSGLKHVQKEDKKKFDGVIIPSESTHEEKPHTGRAVKKTQESQQGTISKNFSGFFVENYIRFTDLVTIDDEELTSKESLCITNCVRSQFDVPKKVKSILVDRCERLRISVTSTLSNVEFVNCRDCELFIRDKVYGISVDNSSSVSINILSYSSKDIKIVTSKSSDLNVSFPEDISNSQPEDVANKPIEAISYKELPIPEQFITTIENNKLVTKISDLY